MAITSEHRIQALVSDVLFCYFSDSPEELILSLTSLVVQNDGAVDDGTLFRRLAHTTQQFFVANPLPSYTFDGSFNPVARDILQGLGRAKEIPTFDEVMHLITISRKTGKKVSVAA